MLVDATDELGALRDVTAVLDRNSVLGRDGVGRVEDVARGHLDLLRAVLATDHLDDAVDLADQRLAFRHPCLEELLDAGETLRDVGATGCDTTGVERPHGELGARFADGLRCDHADRLADLHQPAGGEVAPVAHPADTLAGLAGHDAADLDPADRVLRGHDPASRLIVDVLACALHRLVADGDVLRRDTSLEAVDRRAP